MANLNVKIIQMKTTALLVALTSSHAKMDSVSQERRRVIQRHIARMNQTRSAVS